jgi:hypothetical protein
MRTLTAFSRDAPVEDAPVSSGPVSPAPAYGTIVRRVSSRGALWIAAAWGFAEASFFVVVPDVWLGFVALFAPRRTVTTIAATVAGAAAGAVFLFVATLAFGDQIGRLILALPGITPGDLAAARTALADDGAAALLPALVAGRAVKLYVHAAATDGIPLLDVVLFTMLNRIVRLALFGGLMSLVGWGGRSIVMGCPRLVASIYVSGWVLFYVVHQLGVRP